MTYEFIVPFLEASSFLNLHDADVLHLGINEDVLLLGASFDLQPCDLLKIIHDKSNKLNRNKVMELLNEGVTSISYLSNFYRLREFGFSIREICILAYGSIPVKSIQRYDLSQLYEALGFSHFQKLKICRLTSKPDHHELMFPYIQNGFSVDDWLKIQLYIRYRVTPIQAVSFRDIGCYDVCHIKQYLNAGFSAEQVSPYLKTGIQSCVSIISCIKYGIAPIQAVSFSQCLYDGVSAEQTFEYIEAGIKIWSYDPFITIFMKNGYTATEYLRVKQILSYLDTMSIVCLCFTGILFALLFSFEIELMGYKNREIVDLFLIKYVIPIFVCPIFSFYLGQLFLGCRFFFLPELHWWLEIFICADFDE